jgi:hypothetical protein
MNKEIIEKAVKEVMVADDSTYATIDIAMLVSIKMHHVNNINTIIDYLQDLSDNALQLKKAIEKRL